MKNELGCGLTMGKTHKITILMDQLDLPKFVLDMWCQKMELSDAWDLSNKR